MSPSAATAEDEKVAESRPADTDSLDSLPQAGQTQVPLAVAVSEISVQADDEIATSLSSKNPSDAAKVIPLGGSISHDLPTPPLSEEGDDIETKDVPPEYAAEVSQDPEDPTYLSKRSEGKSSRVSSLGWGRTG